jgi:GT2 family glycosyltransferase
MPEGDLLPIDQPRSDREHAPIDSVRASIVVCTYDFDRWVDFVAAVESVERQARPGDHQVIVVVDHNPELAPVARHRFPACLVIENRFARGLSGARNTGVAAAHGDVVLFLDDDAVADDGWLAAHLAAYEAHEVVGTAGVARPAWDRGAPPGWWPGEFDWVVGCNDQRAVPPGASVRNPIGANMGFRRECIVKAGGFSDRLGRTTSEPLGCEETELAIRITSQDPTARIVSVPDAVCRHRVPPNRTTWRYFRSRCVAEGRSKAVVARLTGIGAATSSERAYTSRVLPSALSSALRRGNLRKAMAILAGVGFAVVGFVPALVEQNGDSLDEDRQAFVIDVDG